MWAGKIKDDSPKLQIFKTFSQLFDKINSKY